MHLYDRKRFGECFDGLEDLGRLLLIGSSAEDIVCIVPRSHTYFN